MESSFRKGGHLLGQYLCLESLVQEKISEDFSFTREQRECTHPSYVCLLLLLSHYKVLLFWNYQHAAVQKEYIVLK